MSHMVALETTHFSRPDSDMHFDSSWRKHFISGLERYEENSVKSNAPISSGDLQLQAGWIDWPACVASPAYVHRSLPQLM